MILALRKYGRKKKKGKENLITNLCGDKRKRREL